MGDFKGALALRLHPLQSFSLFITFKSGISGAVEPIPLEWGRFCEWSCRVRK